MPSPLTDVMPEAWAEPGMWWLRLTNPQPLTDPIPTRGRLGLWTPDQDVLDQAQTQLQEASS